ncbi:BlaI/MecI/CopY family transcriptional regulator [Sphingomicrobium sediminis]|uniref:BlaI/MecI/CopY family transcriptional regulator n=1 Tax=Sphingomicrobium sediminis TaxID=2950949 RepID=A0A9X2EG37_9SPHN|nr:BlaI/MecI/CopY family transcriptional regulator [Sphingomicrobium sediminis]
MADDANITAAEWEVMEVLWRAGAPMSSADIVAAVRGEQEWTEATVRTLLFRLTKKGVAKAERDRRRYLYSPLVERDAYVGGETDRFVDRMFGGRIAPLVAQFASRDKLTDEEIDRLEALLKDIRNG